MAGEKINTYGSTNTNLDSIMETIDADRMAKIDSISLTNMSTTSVPAIEGNSVVEIANSVYRFSTEEAISTSNIASTAAMTYYVELVPSSSQVSAQFSSDTPAWRSDYQGFYTSTTSANRNIGFTYFDGTNYNDKFMMKWHGGVYLDNKIYVNNATDSTATDDGAIISGGSVNAAGNMIAGGDIDVGGEFSIAGTPSVGCLDDGTAIYRKKISIGVWDMDTNASYYVAIEASYGITEDKVVQAEAWIYSDLESTRFPYTFASAQGGYITMASSSGTDYIQLLRETGGLFDSAVSFASTAVNPRGYLYLDYIV